MNRRTFQKLAMGGLAGALAGCGGGGSNALAVYTPHGILCGDIKKRFEAAFPGKTVTFMDMGGNTIYDRVEGERERPGADVWFGGSPGDFARAEKQGLLQPYQPAWMANVPADSKSATGAWVATFRTPEVIMFNPKKIPKAEIPTNWDGLLDAKWKGRIAIRDVRPSTTMKTIFGALLLRAERKGGGNLEKGYDFLKQLDANTVAYAANPQLLNDLLHQDGPAALTVWNQPDAMQLMSKYNLDFVIPKETFVFVEPIAIIKGCRNQPLAEIFVDFVNRPEELAFLAKQYHRIPVRTDIPKEQLPEWMQTMQLDIDPTDWARFYKDADGWIAFWDSNIKNKFSKK